MMAVYVDDVRHRFGRMIMCHMWADTPEELTSMADSIGVQLKWLQGPWVHFDISLQKKALAIARGAILTDKYGPAEFIAKRRGDTNKLETIAACRELPPSSSTTRSMHTVSPRGRRWERSAGRAQ